MIQATVAGKQFIFEENLKDDTVSIEVVDARNLHIIHGTKSFNATLVSFNKEEKKLCVRINGNDYDVVLKNETDLLLEKLGLNNVSKAKVNQLKAPMPGLIVSITASEGSEIKKGEPLVILEAMKMENVIKAPVDVVVKKIRVKEKQAVEKGEILMEFDV